MLDAILTSDVPKDPAAVARALLLNPKGRILADLTMVRDGEDLLLVTEAEGAEAAEETLGRYAPFSRVEVTGTDLGVIGVFGPDAGRLVPEAPASGSSVRAEIGGHEAIVCGVELPAEGLHVILDERNVPDAVEAMKSSGATPTEEAVYEAARVYRSIPRFGLDVTQENFPAEAHLEERAVDFTKGCYPGQETVARMHYRGQPSKSLHRFIVEGEAKTGTPIVQNDKSVGHLTSVSPLPLGGDTYALGYLKRRADVDGELVAGSATLEVSTPASP